MVDEVALSKTLAHALRHEPDHYGLALDPEGWVPIDVLITALSSAKPVWAGLGRADIEGMMRNAKKARYEIEGDRIRAAYGHSVAAEVRKETAEPPARLFHGTSPDVAEIILAEGLKPMGRQRVHLSEARETAVTVGRRKDKRPVILLIDAAKAHADGHAFYYGNDTTWLTDALPARYITAET